MVFLVAVFLSFVIYGLTGSLFPTAWPQMAIDISADYTLVGLLIAIVSFGSGVSSAFAYKIRRKLGTSRSITVGFIFFLLAMVLFVMGSKLLEIGIALAFLGIGNGIIDTVANSYVIKAYDSSKTSLLHASWGFGSAAGPVLMGFALTNTNNYKNGFAWVAAILVVAIIVYLLLKAHWEKTKVNLDKDFVALHSVSEEEKQSNTNLLDIFKIKNGLAFVACFVAVGAINTTLNAWMPTFAVGQRGLSVAEGATTATCYFIGITFTRLILGAIAKKIGNHKIIYGGLIISIIGYLMLFVKNNNAYYMYIVTVIIGIGISPLIPFLHSSVKEIFNEEYMGIVVSCCNSISLAGGAAVSALTTLVSKLIGINNAQALFIVFMIIALILYTKVISSKKEA